MEFTFARSANGSIRRHMRLHHCSQSILRHLKIVVA